MQHSFFNWLFPSYCVQCQGVISAQEGLCDYCLADLSVFDLNISTVTYCTARIL